MPVHPQVMYGYQAFAFALASQYLPCWLANPTYWCACYHALSGTIRQARNYAILAVVLSVSETWMFDDALEAGFYMWSASMGFLATTFTFVPRWKERIATGLPWWSRGEGHAGS